MRPHHYVLTFILAALATVEVSAAPQQYPQQPNNSYITPDMMVANHNYLNETAPKYCPNYKVRRKHHQTIWSDCSWAAQLNGIARTCCVTLSAKKPGHRFTPDIDSALIGVMRQQAAQRSLWAEERLGGWKCWFDDFHYAVCTKGITDYWEAAWTKLRIENPDYGTGYVTFKTDKDELSCKWKPKK